MTYENVTLMFSLPRSATQWWTWVFSHAIPVLHDPLAHEFRPEGLKKRIDAMPEGKVFIADTSAIFFHDRLLRTLPGVQCLYNIRNPADVKESLRKQTGYPLTAVIDQQNEKLFRHAFGADQAHRTYYGVRSYEGVNALWGRVTGLPSPPDETWEYWFNHVVDTPVAQQYRDPVKIKSLMGYAE